VFGNYGIRASVMKFPQLVFFQAAGYNQTVTRYGLLNTERQLFRGGRRENGNYYIVPFNHYYKMLY
jgi:hypothetical protein